MHRFDTWRCCPVLWPCIFNLKLVMLDIVAVTFVARHTASRWMMTCRLWWPQLCLIPGWHSYQLSCGVPTAFYFWGCHPCPKKNHDYYDLTIFCFSSSLRASMGDGAITTMIWCEEKLIFPLQCRTFSWILSFSCENELTPWYFCMITAKFLCSKGIWMFIMQWQVHVCWNEWIGRNLLKWINPLKLRSELGSAEIL